MVGQCGLTWQYFLDQRVLEIGYLFQRVHWKKGYAIEAARACKEYAFEVLHAEEVFSIIRDNNAGSMNVAIRNGMTVRARLVRERWGAELFYYAFAVDRS